MTETGNPYSPPNTPVADVDNVAAGSDMARPREVRFAVALIWWALSVGILGIVHRVWHLPEITPVRLLAAGVSIAAGALFIWWVTSRLFAGRSWMRTLVVVLLLAGLPFVLPEVAAQFVRSPARGTLYALAHGLSYVALYFLLTVPSRDWFRTRS
jgi:hypothetical protein